MQVVVIDDERLSSHNLGIQLKFVGEAPVLSSSENWSKLTTSLDSQDSLLGILVGAIKHVDVLSLLQDIYKQQPDTAILLLEPQAGINRDGLPPALSKKIIVLNESGLNYQSLSTALGKAREQKGLLPTELKSKIVSPSGSVLFRSLTGSSRVIQDIRVLIKQVAQRDVSVLVMGESGTGKEVVARNIHYHSGRSEAPFIVINCAVIDADRYGVELFGQIEPSGQNVITGLLEQAHGGTLYFDEVGELPLNIQTMLLRFLEDKSFHRVGGAELISTDVKIIAGSGQRLEPRIQAGNFRKDLYYRLNLMPIELPPLRKRTDDIADLVKELLRSLESKGYKPMSLNAAAVEALKLHQWQGNVRELANLIERLCIMHSEGIIGVSDLPLEYQHAQDTDALLLEIEAQEAFSQQTLAVLNPDVQETVSKADSSVSPKPAGAASPKDTAAESPETPAPKSDQNNSSTIALSEDRLAEEAASVAAAIPSISKGQVDKTSAILPLNDMLLDHYLFNFEKQLLLTALDDCANILSFAAERMGIDEEVLNEKIVAYKLESF